MHLKKPFHLKNQKLKTKNVKREPWFTSGLLTSSKTRTKLLTNNYKSQLSFGNKYYYYYYYYY